MEEIMHDQNEYQKLNNSHDARFGFIITDTTETLFGILYGHTRDTVQKLTVILRNKYGRRYAGASAVRLARLRIERRYNYARKIAEMAAQCFITNEKVNVVGIILASVAELSSEFQHADLFDPRIQEKLLRQVTIFYGGELGFNQAIDLASETLTNVKLIEQKRILRQFFDEIYKNSGQYCFDLPDTLKELKNGNIKILIIWEKYDLIHYELRHIHMEEIKTVYSYSEEQMLLVDWLTDNCQKLGVKLEIITEKSQEGSQFVHGFTGIGAILRDKVSSQLLNGDKIPGPPIPYSDSIGS